ncbi:MAG: M56 family metallopeptidase [Bacteroidaceae bacterium]|nr:M56 family metallopeptidase [Bacteroidaceae bacterium]
MYIPFLLMLRNESFFRFNRVVLLVIVVLSLVLPLCDVHILSLNLFTAEEQGVGIVDVGIPVYVIDDVDVADAGEVTSEETSFLSSVNWWAVAGWIYLIGMVVTILVKLVQLAMLYRTIHRGVLWTERKDGVRIYCHAGDITPFSWFNTIVISENDYEENAQVIIRHEMGHIVNYHSLDIILVNICEVIQWCNPLSWILVGSLRDVHEYEADDAVLASGVDAHRYQLLLIKKAVGSSSYAFANSFNHSLLKKRITMMVSKKSNPWMRTKALYIIPVALVALSAFATPEFIAPIEEAVSESTPMVDAVSEMIDAVAETNDVSISDKDNVNELEIAMAEISDASKQNKEVADSTDVSISEVKDGASLVKMFSSVGENPVIFVDRVRCNDISKIDKNSIDHINVLKNPETIKKVYGDNEEYKNGVIEIFTKEYVKNIPDGGELFDITEITPEFPGGDKELRNYIQKEMVYPEECLKEKKAGMVILSFIVENDGSLSDLKVIRSVNTEFDKEAIRLVKSMPKWNPARQRGLYVRCKYTLPIIFKLPDSAK